MAGEVIFVISAHDEDAEMITMTLEAGGFLAFQFSVDDIDKALAKGVVPALIFYNPDAAGSRGLEVCRKIHQRKLLESVPIIVATFFEGPMEPRYTRLYGIADFLKKPVSAVDVIEKTEQILAQKSVPPQPEEVVGVEAIAFPPPGVSEGPSSPDEETHGFLEASQSEDEELRPFVASVSDETVRPRNRKKWFLALGVLTLVAAGVAAVSLLLLNRTPTAPERPVPPAIQQPPQVQVPAPGQLGSPQLPTARTDETGQTQETSTGSKVSSKVAQPVEPRAAGRTYYSVQVGAFKSESNAQKLARELKDKGYDASVNARPERDGTMLFRVLSGSFEDRREALQAAAKIQAKENAKVTIFSSTSHN